MKMRSILFTALCVSSLAACGGDREKPTVVPKQQTSWVENLPKVVPDAPAAAPVAVSEAPKPEAVTPVVVDKMPSTFDDALTQGKALASKGEHDRAKELFQAAAKLDGKKAEPYIELSRLYISTNDRAQAVIAANKAVKLAPLSSQAWNTKGRAELNRFDYDKAIEAFSKACELDQDNVWAWNNLGYTELQLKKYDEAVAHLTEATTRKGAEGYMFNNLGTALEQLDRLDEARTAYEAGGKLGSKVAMASRKRLEGVTSDSVAIGKQIKDSETKGPKTFEINEDSSEPDDAGSGTSGEHSTN
ncbi:MAG: tetratricopeptide repeat protein [Deltaproteobacteria bacterium]|nr:tetratricopeptide repeat protein [Deltaproteobacteria bacterium]